MAAGGPAGDAKLQDVRILRGDQPIWSGDAMRRALADGRTLDQMNLRAGDRIVMPQSLPLGSAESAVRTLLLLLTLPLTVAGLIAIFS
jgi:hypothetical protein